MTRDIIIFLVIFLSLNLALTMITIKFCLFINSKLHKTNESNIKLFQIISDHLTLSDEAIDNILIDLKNLKSEIKKK